MDDTFFVDATDVTSSKYICEYLCTILFPIINSKRPIIFLCIGTDRSTGDSLGPLVGHQLKALSYKNVYFYGSLETPVHSKNLEEIVSRIYCNFKNPYIVAIDSCLGSISNIGKVFIDNEPLYPGKALNKDLPPVGDMSITGIVNISGNYEFIVLQNTRLYTVMLLAQCISQGITKFIYQLSKGSNLNLEQIEKSP